MAPKNQRASSNVSTRTLVRWGVAIASALWVVIMIFFEILEADPNRFSDRSPEVEARRNSCIGDYAHRYRCTDRAIIEENQKGFLVWIEKVCIVIGPPIVLWLLLRRAYGNQGDDEENYFTQTPTAIKRRRVR